MMIARLISKRLIKLKESTWVELALYNLTDFTYFLFQNYNLISNLNLINPSINDSSIKYKKIRSFDLVLAFITDPLKK